MARRKAGQAWDDVYIKGRTKPGSTWSDTFLGPNSYNRSNGRSVLDVDNTRAQAAKITDPTVYQEIEMALNGDDSLLLPYQPTPTINPGRPRTLAAGYDERSQSLRIKFRSGEYYTYYNVPPSVWYKFQRASSPGRYINTTLNNYPYSRGLT